MTPAFPYAPADPPGDWIVTLPGAASIGEVILYAAPQVFPLGDYETEVLADGPIAFWMLDEAASSSSFADISGNDHHLTVNTAASGAAGFAGFDPVADYPGGTTDYNTEDDAIDFSSWTEWTVIAWFQTDVSQNLGNIFTCASYVPDRNFELRLTNTAGSPPDRVQAVQYLPPSGFATTETDVDLLGGGSEAVPIFACGRWDGTNLDVFINGVLTDSNPVSLKNFDTQELRVAKAGAGAAPGNRNFAGLLAGIAVFDVAIPDARIAVYYSAGLT